MSQMPNNAEDLTANFQADVNDTANTQNIQNILNMDETFVKFDNPPSYTLNAVGEGIVNIKTSRVNTKMGIRVTHLISNNGDKGKAHVNFPNLVNDGPEMN